MVLQGDQSIKVATKSKFDTIGEIALLGDNIKRTADIIAVEKVVVLCLTSVQYGTLCAILRKGSDNALGTSVISKLLLDSFRSDWNVDDKGGDKVVALPSLSSRRSFNWTKVYNARKLLRKNSTNKTVPESAYLYLWRTVQKNPSIKKLFPSIAAEINWENQSRALYSIYAATRRIASQRVNQRSDEELTFLGHLLDSFSFFEKFSVSPLLSRVQSASLLSGIMRFNRVRAGTVLFPQGVVEGRAYFIISGTINIVVDDVLKGVRQHELLASLKSGSCFGELSLIAKMKRTASAIASGDVDVFYIDVEHYDEFITTHTKTKMQHVIMERTLFLEKVPGFRKCSRTANIRMAHFMKEKIFNPKTILCREGEVMNCIYLIVSGTIAVFRDRIVVENENQKNSKTRTVSINLATLGSGQCFGVSMLQLETFLVEPGVIMSTTTVRVLCISEKNWKRIHPYASSAIAFALESRSTYETHLNDNVSNTCSMPVDSKRPWLRANMCHYMTTLERRLENSIATPQMQPEGRNTLATTREFWDKITTKTETNKEKVAENEVVKKDVFDRLLPRQHQPVQKRPGDALVKREIFPLVSSAFSPCTIQGSFGLPVIKMHRIRPVVPLPTENELFSNKEMRKWDFDAPSIARVDTKQEEDDRQEVINMWRYERCKKGNLVL